MLGALFGIEDIQTHGFTHSKSLPRDIWSLDIEP